MELDFGGLGKEYAVNRCLQLIENHLKIKALNIPVLINFGGYLAVNKSRENNQPWQVGIESPSITIQGVHENKTIAAPKCIQAGFIATLASLQGANAEAFLHEQEIPHWVIR